MSQTPAPDTRLTQAAVRFTVIEDSADDPELNRKWSGLSVSEIRAWWPQFATLFPDDCANSLTFVAELNRWRINPEYP